MPGCLSDGLSLIYSISNTLAIAQEFSPGLSKTTTSPVEWICGAALCGCRPLTENSMFKRSRVAVSALLALGLAAAVPLSASAGTHVGVSVSAELAEALCQNGVMVQQVVPNGLPLHDPAFTGADGARARERHGWGDEPLLVTGGRLHFFKGQNQAVDAFARVAAEHPTARLVILGGKGWYRDTLEERAAGLGVLDRVSFPGFLDRAAYHDVLVASSAFLNLSTYLDPFPTVNLESMALGVPVVATKLGGTPEAIVDGQTGLLVNPFDIEQVAGAVLRLLRDDALRAGLGDAGRARVRERYTVEHMAARYEAIYRGEPS